MPTLAAIPEQRRKARLADLRHGVVAAVAGQPNTEVWLFGSLARGDWNAYSDVDLLAIGPSEPAAEALADALPSAHLGDDVLPLTHERWHELRSSEHPY
ncbi:nucleotidyltransferase domain-containing protein [Synechococcus sp. HJ21-Hayes]|uniref:nucleotidyltransferase domain-containing protein n=1 Tax=unclassified Synechococcus TaxID=2626047 RepID=UPI0020CC6424|nr:MULTISPECIES: nucleotidyltransferase domain-containing protein [unclassified Synechococcus]MCP9832104.1 nucleotidyltransferase domain-containing protein [Synechococcus sp. JJ3a-Johnson]MCP9854018.1 nucleotidyltransferase domain-containing protein [Synechococcus sp. HJ21-Hayes]